ncbi:MAG: cell division protein FtsQ/DivIB [Parvularculaceae bacterium]
MKKKRKSAKKPPPLANRLAAIAQRYALAGVAGGGVILAGAGAVFWAGGYVGVVAESARNALGAGAVASGFAIEKVTLMGRHQTALDDVDTALGPLVGTSILNFDADAARARIEALGWVKAAAVSRLLPDTIHVSIREREPSAVWQMSGALHLIDVDGAVIREIGAYEYSSLPLIVGAGAPKAAADILAALEAHPQLKEMTSALIRVGERRWNMRLRNGLDVKLPDAAFAEALDALAVLHAAHGTLDQPIEYIDLRDPERLVIRKRGEAN